jgi:hypothetical protein
MANPWHHAAIDAKKWGGKPEDYLQIHSWYDHSKAIWPDARHRAVRHHSEGIFTCEKVFGPTITISTGRIIPVRWVGESHCGADFGGRIPTLRDWMNEIKDDAPADVWTSISEWTNTIEDTINPYISADDIVIDHIFGVEHRTSKIYRWLGYLKLRPWMARSALKLSEEFEKMGGLK